MREKIGCIVLVLVVCYVGSVCGWNVVGSCARRSHGRLAMKIEEGVNRYGLTYLRLKRGHGKEEDNGEGQAKNTECTVYTFGACVTSCIIEGKELLFLLPNGRLDSPGKILGNMMALQDGRVHEHSGGAFNFMAGNREWR